MKMLSFLLSTFLFSSCLTFGKVNPAQVVRSGPDGRITLEYFTGTKAHSWYTENFKAAADTACLGRSYEVLEKAAVPSTLEDVKALTKWAHYYWVIKCR